MVSDLLLSGRFRQRGIFDLKAVTRAWQAHLTGRRDHHQELWSLLMLELWFQRFVDRSERRQRAA
jgi:asparagine synthase (glutamine-hydrolysing)